MSGKVLIIDDEKLLREDLATILRKGDLECRTASDGETGIRVAREWTPDVVLCDLAMPEKSGIETIEEIGRFLPESSFLLITAYGSLETAIAAFRIGISDFLTKPLCVDEVIQKVNRCLEMKVLLAELRYHRRRISDALLFSHKMIGRGEAMKQIADLVVKVAGTFSTVLITGESGTGKELVAHAIHEQSMVKDGPFIALNCAAFPEHLLESELFGYSKGAFTGANKDKPGFFELARHGTLFLDEISEMPLQLQAKLLRVVEEKEFIPLGSTKLLRTDVRVIASTNRNLTELVSDGKFREDLFFRLSVVEIDLPPLRFRKEDIPFLIEHFVKKCSQEIKKRCLGVSPSVLNSFLLYDWPGNIRELRNVIERAIIVGEGGVIQLEDLPQKFISSHGSNNHVYSEKLKDVVKVYERKLIQNMLTLTDGNREQAADRLGINPATLYRKMSDLEIK